MRKDRESNEMGDINSDAKGVSHHFNPLGAFAAGGALLCMFLHGCIQFSHTSKIDDGAVYELNRKMYITEKDGLLLVDSRVEHPECYTIKGTLPAGVRLQEATEISHRGFSLWFGFYSNVVVYGEVLDGDFKGNLVDYGDYRQRCPEHGYWYLCPLSCPARALKCLTPEKYDPKHMR